jgi:hypothetical protein
VRSEGRDVLPANQFAAIVPTDRQIPFVAVSECDTGEQALLQRSSFFISARGHDLMKTTKALFSELVYDFQSERWN